MIIYNDTVSGFLRDVDTGALADRLEDLKRLQMNEGTSAGELRSWSNSLSYMGLVLGRSTLPGDVSVSLEYNIPYTDKRIDMIVSGRGPDGNSAAVIIELKQWETAEKVDGKDGIVRTYLNRRVRETTHPSYQAWSYVAALQDFNADVQDGSICLQPCACLHNYHLKEGDPLLDPMYRRYFERAPIFDRGSTDGLRRFLERFIRSGDGGETIFHIDAGRLRPSKSLQDTLASMLRGNREFILLDTQKVAYEDIMQDALRIGKGGKKTVHIVKGGPGTGKSVLAINLLADIIRHGMAAVYVTKNSAPREVYFSRLKGVKCEGTSAKMLFKGSGSFTDAPENCFDVLLTDESHRLNEKSGLFHNKGENQVMEIIRSSRMSVFFIDEHQTVTVNDIGSVQEIVRHANRFDAYVRISELDSQFRCDGSDGYISWLDSLLGFSQELDINDGFDYDFRVFDDPNEMRREIVERNRKNNRSRMVAGYCWNWVSKDGSEPFDVVLPEHDFRMRWNLASTTTWAIDEDSVNEIGCIHTCQGLEFDYVGVIIGNDMRFEDGRIVTDRRARARTDQSLKGLAKRYPDKNEQEFVADQIIRNTYKVLMTRGMKGCYVYCTDKALAEHLRNMIR